MPLTSEFQQIPGTEASPYYYVKNDIFRYLDTLGFAQQAEVVETPTPIPEEPVPVETPASAPVPEIVPVTSSEVAPEPESTAKESTDTGSTVNEKYKHPKRPAAKPRNGNANGGANGKKNGQTERHARQGKGNLLSCDFL